MERKCPNCRRELRKNEYSCSYCEARLNENQSFTANHAANDVIFSSYDSTPTDNTPTSDSSWSGDGGSFSGGGASDNW